MADLCKRKQAGAFALSFTGFPQNAVGVPKKDLNSEYGVQKLLGVLDSNLKKKVDFTCEA